MSSYAIIKTGGKQFRVMEGDIIDVEKLPPAPGSEVFFEEVLFIANGTTHFVGQPQVAGWNVKGEVLEETAGPKVTSIKYKQRKNQRRKFGHRQAYTRVKITAIQAI